MKFRFEEVFGTIGRIIDQTIDWHLSLPSWLLALICLFYGAAILIILMRFRWIESPL